MKKFLARLIGLSAIIIVIIVGLHIVAIYNLRDEVEEAYTLDPTKDVLFLGSSETGCGIEVSPKFHNQAIWFSATTIQSCLMRLEELEERGQLKNVKVCIVPFGIFVLTRQTEDFVCWALYQELPIALKHLDVMPFSKLHLLTYAISNLRYPLPLGVNEELGTDPVVLLSRPVEYRDKKIKQFKKMAQDIKVVANGYSRWDESVCLCYRKMKEICDRNNIEFVMYRAPLLSIFEDAIPMPIRDQVNSFCEDLKGFGICYVNPCNQNLDEYFLDNVHLSREGARRLTEELYKQLGIEIK